MTFKRNRSLSSNEQVQEQFELKCKKCNSTNVVLRYEAEGGYSEYTQWGSSVTIGCNDCKQNDLYVSAD